MSAGSSGATLIASHGAGWVSSSHQVSCTRICSVPSLPGSIQDHKRRSAQRLCLWPAHGSWVRLTWLEAAGQNRCSWSRHLPDTKQLYLNTCPSRSSQHLARISFAHAYFLLKGTSHQGEVRFGPIALLWLPKRDHNCHCLTIAQVVPAHSSWHNFPIT